MPDNVEQFPPLRDPRNRNHIWRNSDIERAINRELDWFQRHMVPMFDTSDPRN